MTQAHKVTEKKRLVTLIDILIENEQIIIFWVIIILIEITRILIDMVTVFVYFQSKIFINVDVNFLDSRSTYRKDLQQQKNTHSLYGSLCADEMPQLGN